MGIHQLSVHHDERQDRLLWRIHTQEGEEFRFWLTRRMSTRLLPAIEQALGRLDSQRSGLIAPDPATRHLLSDMQHQAFLQQADLQTPYAAPENAQRPFGEWPLLVTDAQLTVQPATLLLQLQDHSQAPVRQCELQLTPELVHGLLHLSRQAVARADWALEGTAAPPPEESEAPPASGRAYAH